MASSSSNDFQVNSVGVPFPHQEEAYVFPASYAQQQLWFLDQLETGSAVYNLPSAVRLIGALDHVALNKSLNEVVKRHEVLRTVFRVIDDEVAQIILPSLKINLPMIDLSQQSADARESESLRLVTEESRSPFHLAHGPLIRAALVRMSEAEHIMLITMSHIVSDGWSATILIRELATLYEAYSHQLPSPLPEPGMQYADFTVWQRKLLQGERLKAHLDYWTKQLQNLPQLDLPTDRPRPKVQSFRGAVEHFVLPASLSARLRGLARDEGVTPFMVLLAGFQVFLHRYSGQDDFGVGTPVAGRNHIEFEELIGLFVNTLVLRADLSGDPCFKDLLGRVRDVALNAYAHQDLPFELLVKELQPTRDLSRSPLFQVMFNLIRVPDYDLNISNLKMTPFFADNSTAKFDLTLIMLEDGDVLSGSWEYNADLYEITTIKRMCAHFETLLQGIASGPEQHLSRLPLVTEVERNQLLVEWNHTADSLPVDRCLDELFEAQAERTPQAVAVVSEAEEVTYCELNARANQLASDLRERGVGPETIVGVYLERSSLMVTALLAILKAGCAYLPLDPASPSERLAYILADAQVGVLLTVETLAETLPDHRSKIICLDKDWPACAQRGIENVSGRRLVNSLAYVIYTSGSTGRPKGVAVEHYALVNFLHSIQQHLGLTSDDRLVSVTTLSFDIAALEIFLPLITGACVIMASREVASDGHQLAKYVFESGATVMQGTPATWRMLVDAGWGQNARMKVLCGGEALPRQLAEQLLERVDSVWNLYGPTETTIWSTLCRVESGDGRVPIGRPLGNTQAYVLDEQLRPVPVGVTGELYIGGTGLARGYFRRTELIAEKFVPHPFSQQPGGRLFRTGDLTRYLPDGNIEWLGRSDQQVKIRGFRIELEEIEVLLERHSGVTEAAVQIREEGDDKYLAAYVVPDQNSTTATDQLLNYLRAHLPEYMMPSAFVRLDALPRTPNGKVDRRALPAPDAGQRRSHSVPYVAPRTPYEELLCGIWAELLHLERVGVDDNFFALGGHSLLATQIISRVRDSFKVELQLRAFLESPTVASLARAIDASAPEGTAISIAPTSGARNGQQPMLSFGQQRIWFLDKLEPGTAVFNIPAAVSIKGDLNVAALERAVNELVSRHESLRTTFTQQEALPIPVVSPPGQVPLEIVCLDQLPAAECESRARRLMKEAARQPFDLERGPLVRVRLLKLNENEHILLLTMHHIISDGWSVEIIGRQLAALYEAFSQNLPSPLPELPLQYTDFARWQRQLLQGEVLERLLSYWKQQLGGQLPSLTFSASRSPATPRTFKGASQTIVFSRTITEELRALSRREGATLFMTLLAAFKVLIYRATGEVDILVGTPIARRSRSELEHLVGFFINTLVLRTDLSGDPTFRKLIGRIREVALGAYEHQDLPFEILVSELNPTRQLNRTPLFQVLFIMQNFPVAPLQVSGLTLNPVGGDDETAHFDLTLTATEMADGLIATLEYSLDLFDQQIISRMLGMFENVIDGVIANPDQRISALPLLSEEEAHRLTIYQAAETDGPPEVSVHQLFEVRAEQTPEALAVVCKDVPLTFRELNERANRVARKLEELGIGPDVPVGICAERSSEMIIAILGILKAGGAYVPMDAAYPPDRLDFMIEDSGVPVLLTQERLIGRLPKHDAQVVCLETLLEAPPGEPATDAANYLDADNLVYLIYTSGSTGKPKGVMIQHRSLTNYTVAACQKFEMSPADRVLQFAALSWDTSAEEIFPCLASGATLFLRTEAMVSSVSEFLRKCREWELTVLNLPTAFWHQLVDRLKIEPQMFPPTVRLVIIGGEQASPEKLKIWHQCVGHQVRLVNTYGTTESAPVATLCNLEAPGEAVRETYEAPIGAALNNIQTYVLDGSLRLVPVGFSGDFYLGGVGLARGYLKRPDLTAEKFIPHPFRTGQRLYKTGDQARLLPNGNLEFMGRLDHQVKIRGHRVELEEVEAALAQHPAVNQAVVVAHPDASGTKRLVAYLLVQESHQSLTAEMRGFLKGKLPDYMVPVVFVVVNQLPLTPSGKIDRRALPAPDTSRRSMEVGYLAPRDSWEARTARIWEEVLQVHPVGVRDNFFDLGGHSLLAVVLMAKIEQQFGQSLPLMILFHDPTVEQVANILRQERKSQRGSLFGGLLNPVITSAQHLLVRGERRHKPLVNDNGSRSKLILPKLRERFGWVSPRLLFQNLSLYRLLLRHLKSVSPLVAIQPEGLRPPFFFVPGIVGTVFYLYHLARHLGADQPFYGLQAPGIDGKSQPLSRVEDMAARYIEELQVVQPKGPYFLGGHSFGGYVAFEMAQQLEKQGHEVALVALIDTVAPVAGSIQDEGTWDDARLLAFLASLIGSWTGKQLKVSYEELQHLGPDEQMNHLKEWLKRINPLIPLLGEEMMRGLVGVLKAGIQSQYAPPGIYPNQITLFRASDIYSHNEFGEISPETFNDPTLGWGHLSSKPVKVYSIPGDHVALMAEPHAQTLADLLRSCIDEAQACGQED